MQPRCPGCPDLAREPWNPGPGATSAKPQGSSYKTPSCLVRYEAGAVLQPRSSTEEKLRSSPGTWSRWWEHAH